MPIARRARRNCTGYHCSRIILVDDIRGVGKKDLGFPGEDWTHISLENIYAACGADKIMADFQIHLPGQNLQYVIALRN